MLNDDQDDNLVFHETEDGENTLDSTVDDDEMNALTETTAWYQDALNNLLEEPEDSTILATFKEAKKALDAARTARGFYPVRNPNSRSGGKEGYKGAGKRSGKGADYSDKYCLRCGKKGHIARTCPQKPQFRGRTDGGDNIGFAGCAEGDSDYNWHVEGHAGDSRVFQATADLLSTHAILDSGASDNIVGVETLQDWCEHLERLGFGASVFIDRTHHKRFTFGNNASSAALGKAYVNVGLYNHNLELELHVVEGATPFLLSAKFLADMNASVPHITRARAITLQHSPAPHSSIHLGKFRPTAPLAHSTGPFPEPNSSTYVCRTHHPRTGDHTATFSST